MATVQNILDHKGTEVFAIPAQATIRQAAQKMNEYRVGALVVMDSVYVAGILTERDVLQRVVAQGRDPAEMRVEQIMTREVIGCDPQTTIDEARSIMKQRRIRHLPVTDPDGMLLGLVSIGDLNAWALDNQEITIHHLQEYLYGQH